MKKGSSALLRTPNNHHHIAKLNPFSVVHLLISNFKLAFGVNWQSYWSRLAPVIGDVFDFCSQAVISFLS
jgi:hypothetical protein